jgi:general secretion pathway protein G
MKLRCSYCREEFGPEPQARCPHCGRVMRLPDRLLPAEVRERRKARTKARQREEQREGSETVLQALSARRPALLMGLLALLMVAGGLLAGRATVSSRAASAPPSQAGKAEAALHAMRAALERFRIDCGRYPSTAEGLRALVRDSDFIGWRGNYINRLGPDPWSRKYVYRLEGQAMTLLSLGPDGREGTADDVVPGPPDPDEVAGPAGQWSVSPPSPPAATGTVTDVSRTL